jgi:hypothetical protein
MLTPIRVQENLIFLMDFSSKKHVVTPRDLKRYSEQEELKE